MAFSGKYGSREYEIARKIHIKNLRKNHPAKQDWCREAQRQKALKDWDGNNERRLSTSSKMTENWSIRRDQWMQIALANLPDPMRGKDNGVSIELEFYGKTYYGYRELMEATGVSKHLYKKYYLNGIDPRDRVGKNGPAAREVENV